MKEVELPIAFVERVTQDSFLGPELVKALDSLQPTSIRTNSIKNNRSWENAKPIPWSKYGLHLTERPKYTLDPHFHGGAYYPQEAGSQFIDYILRNLSLPEDPIVLDLCAAPGGKSTLIADFLEGKGVILANEVIQSRSKILKENLNKWGGINTLVSNNDPADFQKLTSLFDCILIDAPCSGEGMFRKDLDARNEWSEDNVHQCAARQKRIVMDVWNSLKPGGYLIYSTCTFNAEENEKNVAWIVNQTQANVVQLTIPHAKSGRDAIGYYALPHLLDTEGFYVCVLQKEAEEPSKQRTKGKQPSKINTVKTEAWMDEWIQVNDSISIVQWSQFLFAIPKAHQSLIEKLHSELRLIKLGTELGELSRKGLIPHEALALDNKLVSPAIPHIELTLEQALHYLKGETFPLEGTPGFRLVSYKGTCLGWIKHLGNRFNNLFPKEWRIRMRID